MDILLNPNKDSILYEDERLYICLASFPITKGHTIVVWKNKVEDLHLLSRQDYEYLMDTVDIARNMLLNHYHVEKVYLLYLDEAKQVHWHLVPRYDEQGYNLLNHNPKEITEFNDVGDLKNELIKLKS